MSFRKNTTKLKIFSTAIAFAILTVIFLLSGSVVNNLYEIEIPEPDKIIQSNLKFPQMTIDPESIKILSWNIYKGKKDGWRDDFQQLSKDMDIILIQEALLNDQKEEYCGVRGMGWYFAQSFSYSTESTSTTGIMTLSKARPLVAACSQTRFKEPLTHTPKISLLTEYSLEKSQTSLLVVNIHGINFVKSSAFESQLTDLEKKIKEHLGPVIFAGDFNTWNRKRVSILSKITNRLGLKEADFSPDNRTKRFGYVIDHVFYKGLKIKDTNVFKNVSSSDHKAVSLEFYYPGQADPAVALRYDKTI